MKDWMEGFLTILKTISQILTAGIAITSFALLLYSLTFNLKDRVARTFAAIMLCVTIVFAAESFSGTSLRPEMIGIWLKIQWVGIIMLPATYLHFSDALLSTTGQPSRWRRKLAVRLTYLFSFGLIILLTTPWFLGGLIMNQPPAPHYQRTVFTELFTLYYVFIMVLAWFSFIRAYRRTVTKTSKRRMLYLTTSALAPAIASFPFLLYGSVFASSQTALFWLLAILVNVALGGFIFIMAYSVAFFGVPWPDRVVKSRLIKWVLRGPVTASLALAFTTLVRRGGEAYGTPYSAYVPIVMIVTVLLSEYGITLFFPYLEKWLFFGKDQQDLLLIRSLEERIITRSDLRQFVEMVLAAVCDRLQVQGAFLVSLSGEGINLVAETGQVRVSEAMLDEMEANLQKFKEVNGVILWGGHILLPLKNNGNGNSEPAIGYLGLSDTQEQIIIDIKSDETLKRLIERAMIALHDREMQVGIFETLERMNPQEEVIQQLRAAGRFDRQGIIVAEDTLKKKQMTLWVKDALTHYWGGPKLTESPLLKLDIVKSAMAEADQNPANALRSVLKSAIEQIRPEGERKYTGEWILYNILDLKFLEGKKVREIAMRLSVSEADLYRKQRVAIDSVADVLVQTELKNNTGK